MGELNREQIKFKKKCIKEWNEFVENNNFTKLTQKEFMFYVDNNEYLKEPINSIESNEKVIIKSFNSQKDKFDLSNIFIFKDTKFGSRKPECFIIFKKELRAVRNIDEVASIPSLNDYISKKITNSVEQTSENIAVPIIEGDLIFSIGKKKLYEFKDIAINSNFTLFNNQK